jgi:hypothetical protein
MVSTAELLADLRRQGFDLCAVEGGIRVQPASRLTAELRGQILERKAELLALLRGWVSPATAERVATAGPPDRPLFVLLRTGHVERVAALARAPAAATFWCREGDAAWTPLGHPGTVP